MYKLLINVGAHVWALLFKEKEGVDKAENTALGFLRGSIQPVAGPPGGFATADMRSITIEDDYGQRAHIVAGALSSVLIEDLDLTQEAMIKLHLHNQHTQIKAQQRVNSDSTIKAAAQLGNGGGPMFDPMAGRRFS